MEQTMDEDTHEAEDKLVQTEDLGEKEHLNSFISITLTPDALKFCPNCGCGLEIANAKLHFKDCIKSFKFSDFQVQVKRKVKCRSCHENFATEQSLEKHRYFCDPTSNLAEFVGKAKDSDGQLDKKAGKTKKTNRPKVTCPICHKTYNQKAYLVNHMNIHTGERPHKCKYCEKGFKDYSGLRNHIFSHEDVKNFKCDQCEKAFRKKEDLTQHKLKHLGIKPHVCAFCAKAFRGSRSLKIHEKNYHSSESTGLNFYEFSCPTCSESFKNDTSLRDHEIRAHGNRGKVIKCHFTGCNRDFTNSAILRNHLRTHTDERPFSCPFCECKFKAKFHMENHSKRHTKIENQFSCLYCSQSFDNPEKLKEHGQESHAEKSLLHQMSSHDCQKCAQKFAEAQLLNEHIKEAHNEDGPYDCDKSGNLLQFHEHEKSHFILESELDMAAVETMKIEDFMGS